MNCQSTITNTEVAILNRVFDPEKGGLSPQVAESILGIALPEEDRRRLEELAEKARAGSLSPEEETELENYRHVGRLLELMKSKARRSLQKVDSGS